MSEYSAVLEFGNVIDFPDGVPFVKEYVFVPLPSGIFTFPDRSAVLKISMISSAFSTAYCFFVDVVPVFVAMINALVIG